MPRSGKMHSSWRARVPPHWGKKTWDALFLLAADYPHEQDCEDDDEYPPELIAERKRAWKKILKALPGALTCGVCSYHFEKYMQDEQAMERALQNREELFKWLYKAKDQVNKRNSRKSISLGAVRKRYIPKCKKAV